MSLIETFLDSVQNEELLPPIRNAAPFIQCSGWNQKKYFKPYYSVDVNYPILLSLDESGGSMYLSLDIMKVLAREIFLKYWHNPSILEERGKHAQVFMNDVNSIYDECSHAFIRNTSYERAIKKVQDATEKTWHMNAILFFTHYFDLEMCTSLLKEVGSSITSESLDPLWEKYTLPINDSFDQRRLKYMLDLFSNNTADDMIVEKCQYYEANYAHVPSFQEAQQVLKQKYSKYRLNAIPELADLKQASQQRLVDHQEWLQTLDEEQKRLAEYIQFIIHMRDLRKDYISKTLTIVYRLAQKMFTAIDGNPEDIFHCTYFELTQGVDYLKSIKDDIHRRRNGTLFLIPPEGYCSMEPDPGHTNKRMIEEYILNQVDDISEIRGQTAYSGVIKGKVRVINDLINEAGTFKDGEILVTGMTRPEFIPLIRKAKAIVTDEGGITCHAAIVSRELKKPCIIGTKIATKVLKDGDIVEVDAEKGKVTVIK